MTLKVLGAGLGRTGTRSLQTALERLLGGRCYHMGELFRNLPEHLPYWQAAAKGEPVNWDSLFANYVAAVDEPVVFFWQTLIEVYPEALVILSVRDPDEWWESADRTIMEVKRQPPSPDQSGRVAWYEMIMTLYNRFYPNGINDAGGAKAAFREHVAKVKASVPKERLLIWQAGDGWEPICNALNLPVPDEPFPHTNTREELWTLRQKHLNAGES